MAVYDEYVRARMSKYHSKYDLLHWLSFWTEEARLGSPFSGISEYENLKEKSATAHQDILAKIFNKYDLSKAPHAGYDIWNAIDGYIVDTQCDNVSTVLVMVALGLYLVMKNVVENIFLLIVLKFHICFKIFF